MEPSDKVALVTGGARRIGRAIALDLAANGFPVVVHHRNSSSEAESLIEEISRLGGKARAIRADLAVTEEACETMSRASEPFGPVRLLVNNASLFLDDDAAGFNPDTMDLHFSVHAKAPALLARDMAALLPEGGGGLVVNVIDQRVWRPNPRFFSYSLSKAALWSATQTMAQSFAPRIRVNAIGPGPALQGERQTKEDFDAQVRSLLLRRGPELREFGATVRYFWDAPSVTGQMIALDGGQHLAWRTPDATLAE